MGAQPGQIVAAELGMATAIRQQRDWKAPLQFAAPDALIFRPGPLAARQNLRGPIADNDIVARSTSHVWSSCDGTLAVANGEWRRPDGTSGQFVTVWQRQSDGSYKWLLSENTPLPPAEDERDMIHAEVADCRTGLSVPVSGDDAAPVPGNGSGLSRDRTLGYEWAMAPDNSRSLTVSMIDEGAARQVLSVEMPAGGR